MLHIQEGETKMYKVTLTLDEHGNLIGVESRDRKGRIMETKRKNIGVDWTSNGTIDNVTSVTILSKPGHSPCCAVSGGEVWCWC